MTREITNDVMETRRVKVECTGELNGHRHMTVGDLARVLEQFDPNTRLDVNPFGRRVDNLTEVHFDNLYGHAGPQDIVSMNVAREGTAI